MTFRPNVLSTIYNIQKGIRVCVEENERHIEDCGNDLHGEDEEKSHDSMEDVLGKNQLRLKTFNYVLNSR